MFYQMLPNFVYALMCINSDISITGIGVYTTEIDVSDATSSTHCMVNQTDAYTTTDSILALSMSGVSVEPSTCKGK